MLFLLILVAAAVVLGWVIPTVAATAARNVVNGMDRSRSTGSIDQDMVEARLARIEEAIDAMALQIERLGDQQRALPKAPQPLRDDAGQSRSEGPR